MTDSSLLIVHQGALGDVILTFPAIIGLQKRFSRIDVLCQNQLGKLAVKLELVKNWYPLEAAYFATLFTAQADQKIKDILVRYSTILLFSFSSALENSVNQITGHPSCRIPPRPPAQNKIHVAEFLFKNLIDCGLLEAADLDYEIFNLQRKRAQKTRRPVNAAKFLIHPGSGSQRKRWPLVKFLELEEVLRKRGLQPEFVCGPAEEDLIDELQHPNRNVHRLSELSDLVDLFESAGGYVGNDSGVSHLAAFLGLPVIVIFGPADPVRWKPLGPKVEIVYPELDCNPCFEIEPENCPEPRCLTDATLEAVVRAFERAYKR